MKKTKVVCTMGPNTNDRELLKKLIENGMDVDGYKFSHGDHEGSAERTATRIEYKHCNSS